MTITSASRRFYGRTYGGNATENYERYFVPVIGRPLAADLVEAAHLFPGERILDVACGTGIVARLALDRVGATGTVAGADVNAGMLAVARTVAAASGHDAIQWYETAAEAMPLSDATFDVVFCQLALQFFADRSAALKEMRRVLVPGGRALVNVPAPTEFFDIFEQAMARHAGAAAGAFVHQVFSLNEAGELEQLFRDAGFTEISIVREPKPIHLPAAADFFWQYVQCTPLAAVVEQLDEARRSAMEQEAVGGWQRWTVDGGMRYEQPVLRASARK
jgi:ubiquinone/menaquinone biosynthesis C-methylase UbiE